VLVVGISQTERFLFDRLLPWATLRQFCGFWRSYLANRCRAPRLPYVNGARRKQLSTRETAIPTIFSRLFEGFAVFIPKFSDLLKESSRLSKRITEGIGGFHKRCVLPRSYFMKGLEAKL